MGVVASRARKCITFMDERPARSSFRMEIVCLKQIYSLEQCTVVTMLTVQRRT